MMVYVRVCACVRFSHLPHVEAGSLLVLLLAYDLPSSSPVAASFLKRGVLG